MKTKPKNGSLLDKIQRHVRALELGKKNYKRADALLDEIALEMEPGQVLPLDANGKKFKLKDNFAAGKTRMNVGLNARRYEIEVIEA